MRINNQNVQRRQFLAAASAGMAAVMGSARQAVALGTNLSASEQSSDSPVIVDTHQHLWNLKEMVPPWLSDAPDVLRQNYGLTEYAKATQGLNVTQAVYMEVDVDPKDQLTEARQLLEICRSGKGPTVGAVISGRPDSDEFDPYIRQFRDASQIKGVRQVLHVDSAPAGYCLGPRFVKSVQLLGELGMSFDLCMRPQELADGAALARRCPGTRFVLDHCGNADPSVFLPDSIRKSPPEHDPDQWRRDITALSRCENVICKISGVIASAPKRIAPADSLAPIVTYCLDQFGPDRVVFGGDWPVCLLGGSFRDWVTALKQIISDRPAADQKKLLSLNAKKFYRLPE